MLCLSVEGAYRFRVAVDKAAVLIDADWIVVGTVAVEAVALRGVTLVEK